MILHAKSSRGDECLWQRQDLEQICPTGPGGPKDPREGFIGPAAPGSTPAQGAHPFGNCLGNLFGFFLESKFCFKKMFLFFLFFLVDLTLLGIALVVRMTSIARVPLLTVFSGFAKQRYAYCSV